MACAACIQTLIFKLDRFVKIESTVDGLYYLELIRSRTQEALKIINEKCPQCEEVKDGM